MEAIIDIKDNCINGDVYLKIKDSKETLNAKKVNKVSII
jgi:hypothetical protein